MHKYTIINLCNLYIDFSNVVCYNIDTVKKGKVKQMEKKVRIMLLEQMHSTVINEFDDEENIMVWLMLGVPDCPSEDDFEFIAEDDENFNETVALFNRLCKLEGMDNG